MSLLLDLVEIFAMYLLVSLLFRMILKILPGTISSGFSVIGELRVALAKFIRSLYKTEDNFEVNMLTIFMSFATMLLVYSFGSALVLLNTDAPIINIWLVLALVFVVSFMAPTEEELQVFRKSRPSSIFLFIFKIFLALQLVVQAVTFHAELIALALLITPISPYLD